MFSNETNIHRYMETNVHDPMYINAKIDQQAHLLKENFAIHRAKYHNLPDALIWEIVLNSFYDSILNPGIKDFSGYYYKICVNRLNKQYRQIQNEQNQYNDYAQQIVTMNENNEIDYHYKIVNKVINDLTNKNIISKRDRMIFENLNQNIDDYAKLSQRLQISKNRVKKIYDEVFVMVKAQCLRERENQMHTC